MKRVPDGLLAEGDVRLGYISGVFGLQGELRLVIYNPASDFLGRGQEVELVALDGSRQGVRLRVRPGAGKRILGRLDGVGSPEEAGRLVGMEIVVSATHLPSLEQNDFYHHQLIGLPVRSTAGEAIGVIVAIHSAGETDCWEIHGPGGERFLPAVSEVIQSVDLEDGVVVVDGAGQVVE